MFGVIVGLAIVSVSTIYIFKIGFPTTPEQGRDPRIIKATIISWIGVLIGVAGMLSMT